MQVRAEQPADRDAIRQVNVAAFGRQNEANLVDRLRDVATTASFVAAEAEQILAHVCFSPVAIESPAPVPVWGLAPVAVLPAYQRQGIGTVLIRQSLAACADLGCKAVVVLGNPNFYSRFGFVTAKQKGLKCEYDLPDELFMVLGLEENALNECSGTVRYRAEFSECE